MTFRGSKTTVILFNLYKTTNPDYLKTVVSFSYEDKNDQNVILKRTVDNSNDFDLFHDVLNNKIELLGDYTRLNDPNLIGLFDDFRFIQKYDIIEVINTGLKNGLSRFEKYIWSELEK